MERSYLEVKVSFLHIVVLLAGVILIGSFLFYLGYQAGKSSMSGDGIQAETLADDSTPEEIQLADMTNENAKKKQKNAKQPAKKPSIKDELKLHQLPPETKKSEAKPEPVNTKPIQRESYYAIQVGAFGEYSNAKKYSAKFAKMGYPTEILTKVQTNRKLFKVRVGNFGTRSEAMAEKRKLEKMEKRKFAVVKPN